MRLNLATHFAQSNGRLWRLAEIKLQSSRYAPIRITASLHIRKHYISLFSARKMAW
jgi:hypothetical protein